MNIPFFSDYLNKFSGNGNLFIHNGIVSKWLNSEKGTLI